MQDRVVSAEFAESAVPAVSTEAAAAAEAAASPAGASSKRVSPPIKARQVRSFMQFRASVQDKRLTCVHRESVGILKSARALSVSTKSLDSGHQ